MPRRIISSIWKYNPIHTYIPVCIHPYLYAVIFLLTSLVVFMWLSLEAPDRQARRRILERDGYVVLPGVSRNEMFEEAIAHLPPGYVFLKYRYTIRGCSLSTFHRDVTSSSYVFQTQHPVYTFIVYRSRVNMPLMSVCPGSHTTTPFLYSSPVVISASTDSLAVDSLAVDSLAVDSLTGVLFDCDLVHAGALDTYNANRHVEQYKIAHVDDLPKLKHLSGIDMNKTCEKPTVSYAYEWASRRSSWIFAHIFNHHFTPYLQNRPDNHFGRMLVSLYGRDFYNQ